MVMIPNAPRLGDMPKGEPVPEGVYHIRADKVEYALSNTKKEPMAEVTFTIFGPPEAEEFHGRKIFENFMLTGGGMFRTRQFLEATGENEDFTLEDSDQLLQRECAAAVQVEPARTDPATGKQYNSKNKITRFLLIQ